MTDVRALGASGISTIPLMLGGNVFGWTADRAASFAVLDRFVERGGSLIDTADVYSAWIPGNKGGESETILGEWLKVSGMRDRVAIATKVGMLEIDGASGLSPAHIGRAVDASLRRLQTDHIDLYFAHRDDPDVPQEEVLGAFDRLVRAGKVTAIGASNFTADRLKSALAASDAGGLARYTVLEPDYNLVTRGGFEGALQELCVAEKVGVVPYFGLASGFLTGKYRSEADLAKSPRGYRVKDYFNGSGMAVLAAMDRIAGETGASLAAIALAWLAAQPAIVAPIASAVSVEQLDQLFAAPELRLSEEQLARLSAAGRADPSAPS